MKEEKDNVPIEIEEDPFSMLPNDFIRDPNISNEAVRIFAIIKSYIGIKDFILYRNTIKKAFCGGEYSFKKGWKELKDLGYLIQIKHNTSKGFKWSYKLVSKPINCPQVDSPSVVGPSVDFPPVGNQHSYKELLNNNNSNKNIYNNNNKIKIEKENKETNKINKSIVVEKESNLFDIDRFINSELVKTDIARYYEAYGNAEITDNAINLLTKICNSYGVKKRKIINSFTDKAYQDLLHDSIYLVDPDIDDRSIRDKSAYLNSRIQYQIDRYLENNP